MPKICIKCKKDEKSGIEVYKYEYSRTKTIGVLSSSSSYSTASISFPICHSCRSDFKSYQKFESFFDATKRYLIIISIIAWIFALIEIINITINPYHNRDFSVLFTALLVAIITPIFYSSLYM